MDFIKNRLFLSFIKFKELIDKKELLTYHGDLIKIEDNIFGSINFVINNEIFCLFESEINESNFKEVFTPLFDILIKDELTYIHNELIKSPEFKKSEYYKGFLNSFKFSEETFDEYIEFDYQIQFDDEYFPFNEFSEVLTYFLDINSDPEYSISFNEFLNLGEIEFRASTQNEYYYIHNWKNSDELRMKVLLKTTSDPNSEYVDFLEELFTKVNLVSTLEKENIVSIHYSDLKSESIAFNIKSYELFAHEKLNELGFYTYDNIHNNRNDSINNLLDELDPYIFEYSFEGKSGGYLKVMPIDFDLNTFNKIKNIITEALEYYPKFYSSLESLDIDVVQEFLDNLCIEDLSENDKKIYDGVKIEINEFLTSSC